MKNLTVTLGFPSVMMILVILKLLKLIDISWFWVIALPVLLPIGVFLILGILIFLGAFIIALLGN